MVKKIKLEAKTRAEKIKEKEYIPGVLYGRGVKNKNIKIKNHDLDLVYSEAGESSLVDLDIDGKESLKVIIKDIQKNGVTDKIIHADFYQVDMTQKIEVELPLNFINESKAVKELGGTLFTNLDTLHVKCLPGDLLESFDVDISVLETFNDQIRVSDLKLPNNIETINSPDESVAQVEEATVEEEPTEEEPTEEGGVEGEEKKEEGDKNGEENKEGDKKTEEKK